MPERKRRKRDALDAPLMIGPTWRAGEADDIDEATGRRKRHASRKAVESMREQTHWLTHNPYRVRDSDDDNDGGDGDGDDGAVADGGAPDRNAAGAARPIEVVENGAVNGAANGGEDDDEDGGFFDGAP